MRSLMCRDAAEDPALGAPVEYIDLRGSTYDSPVVCKYTGLSGLEFSLVHQAIHRRQTVESVCILGQAEAFCMLQQWFTATIALLQL